MLTLTRKVGQSIIINDQIEVCFSRQCHFGKIQLTIYAPKSDHVDRKETHQKHYQKRMRHKGKGFLKFVRGVFR